MIYNILVISNFAQLAHLLGDYAVMAEETDGIVGGFGWRWHC